MPLTPLGLEEAKRGGAALRAEGVQFKSVYTSVLKRAIKTCWTVLEELDQMYLPVRNEWRLNERHYGALQGLNKAETAAKHGEELVTLWRRSYDVPPPPLDDSHQYWPGRDPRYAGVDKTLLPLTESLATTGQRVLPLWNAELKAAARQGPLLVVAHGNSLRALIKEIDGFSNEAIIKLNLPTGVPLLYRFDDSFKPIKQNGAIDGLSGRYLGDMQAIIAASKAVAEQASAGKKGARK